MSVTRYEGCRLATWKQAVAVRRHVLLAGALVLTLVITGTSFARAFTERAVTTGAVLAEGDFASISPAPGQPVWTVFGAAAGATGSGDLFIIEIADGFRGNLEAVVRITNAGQLISVYRSLHLFLCVLKQDATPVDINGDGSPDEADIVLLGMAGAGARFFIGQVEGPCSYIIRLDRGCYTACPRPSGGWRGSASPAFYAEVIAR